MTVDFMLDNSQFLKSLRIPSFRLLWTNNLLSSLCRNTQRVLITWLVLETTNSPLLLGLIQALNFVPMIFGAMAGVLADRINRLRLLMVINTANVALSLIFGILIVTGQIQFWHLALFTFLGGVMWTSQGPSRQVYTLDLVGESNLTNAAALNALSMRLSRVISSFLIGAFVSLLGIGTFFFILAGIYVAATILLVGIQVKTVQVQRIERKSALRDLVDGLKYVGSVKTILGLQLIALISNMFAIPCDLTLVPLFAHNVLQVDATRFGWLMMASGVGMFIVGSIIAVFSDSRRKGLLLAVSTILEGIIYFLLPTSTSYPATVMFYVCGTMMRSIYMMMINILLLSNSTPDMRGRVMGVRSLVIFPLSTGNLIAGSIANMVGITASFWIESSLSVLFMLSTLIWIPKLKKLE